MDFLRTHYDYLQKLSVPAWFKILFSNNSHSV
jgi:hypothetical protein